MLLVLHLATAHAADLAPLLDDPDRARAGLLAMAFVGGPNDRIEALVDDERLGDLACRVVVRTGRPEAALALAKAGRGCAMAELSRTVPPDDGLPVLARFLNDDDRDTAAFQGMVGYGPAAAPYAARLVDPDHYGGSELAALGVDVLGPLAARHPEAANGLGASGDPAALPYLQRCAPSARERCARALERLALPEGRVAARRYARDKDDAVRWAAIEALVAMGPEPKDAAWLVEHVDHDRGLESAAAVRALEAVGTADLVPTLLRKLASANGLMDKEDPLDGLGALGPAARDALPAVRRIWQTGNDFEKADAIGALARIAGDDPAVFAEVEAALGSPDRMIALAAHQALQDVPGDRAAATALQIRRAARVDTWEKAYRDRVWSASRAGHVDTLVALMASEDLRVSMAAADAATAWVRRGGRSGVLTAEAVAQVLIPRAVHAEAWCSNQVAENLAELGVHPEVLVAQLAAPAGTNKQKVAHELAWHFPDHAVAFAAAHPERTDVLKALQVVQEPTDAHVAFIVERLAAADDPWWPAAVLEAWLR